MFVGLVGADGGEEVGELGAGEFDVGVLSGQIEKFEGDFVGEIDEELAGVDVVICEGGRDDSFDLLSNIFLFCP